MIRRVFPLPLFLFVFLCMAPAPGMAKPPAVDARIVSEKCTITVALDHRTVTECHQEEEVYTLLAMDQFADPRIRWRADTQQLTVLSAFSLAPRTQKRTDTPDHAINVVTPFFQELTPGATFWRETVISHVGVETGSRLVRSWKREDTKATGPLDATFPLLRVRPVDHLEYRFRGVPHLALVDPPASCKLEGRPPDMTVTCRNLPGTGTIGLSGGRRMRIDDELVARLPRVVVSTHRDTAALRADLLSLRRPVPGGLSQRNTGEKPKWPEFLFREMQTQVSDAGRFETLRHHVLKSFRLLQVPRPPVSLEDVLEQRAATAWEKALLLDAALRAFVPAARNVRTAHMSSHGVIAARIPGLAEFPHPVVILEIDGKELIVNPATGETGPWPAFAADTWILDPVRQETPVHVPGTRGGHVRTIHAVAKIGADGRISWSGQSHGETYSDLPDCARMVPSAMGKPDTCDIRERSPGVQRVAFTSETRSREDGLLVMPDLFELLDPQFSSVPQGAGVSMVLPVTRVQFTVELEWTPGSIDWIWMRSGSWVIPNRHASGFGAALHQHPYCEQRMHSRGQGRLVISGFCDNRHRYHYGNRVKPEASIGFIHSQPFRDTLVAGPKLSVPERLHQQFLPMQLLWKRPAP